MDKSSTVKSTAYRFMYSTNYAIMQNLKLMHQLRT